MLRRIAPVRSYEKTYNLAGILMSYIYHNLPIINVLHLTNATKPSARSSDI